VKIYIISLTLFLTNR